MNKATYEGRPMVEVTIPQPRQELKEWEKFYKNRGIYTEAVPKRKGKKVVATYYVLKREITEAELEELGEQKTVIENGELKYMQFKCFKIPKVGRREKGARAAAVL